MCALSVCNYHFGHNTPFKLVSSQIRLCFQGRRQAIEGYGSGHLWNLADVLPAGLPSFHKFSSKKPLVWAHIKRWWTIGPTTGARMETRSWYSMPPVKNCRWSWYMLHYASTWVWEMSATIIIIHTFRLLDSGSDRVEVVGFSVDGVRVLSSVVKVPRLPTHVKRSWSLYSAKIMREYASTNQTHWHRSRNTQGRESFLSSRKPRRAQPPRADLQKIQISERKI